MEEVEAIEQLPRKDLRALIDSQSQVTSLIVAHAPIDEVMAEIVRRIEDSWPATMAAIVVEFTAGRRSVTAGDRLTPSVEVELLRLIDEKRVSPAPIAQFDLDWGASVVFVPIGRPDAAPLNCLVVVLAAGDSIDDAELELLRRYGELAELALDRHETELQLQRLIAEERATLAGVLHDDPIQAVTAVGLRLQRLRRHVDDEGGALLRDVEAAVATAVDRMRRLLIDLHPPTLGDEGLAAAVDVYFGEVLEPLDLECRLDDQLVDQPLFETASLAYRLITEALWNVAKHAEASRVAVHLEGAEGSVRVRVTDDGKGFDSSIGLRRRAGHMGMSACRELASRVSGSWTVHSIQGSGTTVEFELPGSNMGTQL